MQVTETLQHARQPDLALSVREAMDTSPPSQLQPQPHLPPPAPPTHAAPEPHLPLRKASARRLRSATSAPRPLFDAATIHEAHEVRGFRPSPVKAVPRLVNVTASNEHAFAGKTEGLRKPFHLPFDVQALRSAGAPRLDDDMHSRPSFQGDPSVADRPHPSPLRSAPTTPRLREKSLNGRRSFGEGLKGLRQRLNKDERLPPTPRTSDHSNPDSRHTTQPSTKTEEIRDSFRSAITGESSLPKTSSVHTDRTSLTGDSSQSDFVNVYPDWPDKAEAKRCASMTVEDAIDMYGCGFDDNSSESDAGGEVEKQEKQETSAKPPPKYSRQRSATTSDHTSPPRTQPSPSLPDIRPVSQPGRAPPQLPPPLPPPPPPIPPDSTPTPPSQVKKTHRRSQSVGFLIRTQTEPHANSLQVPTTPRTLGNRTFSQILAPIANKVTEPESDANIPRDRYGFKKASQNITVEEYDAWNAQYTEHLERRTKKWEVLMSSYGLSTEKPFRFPPRTDKIRRYVRKGIPPDLRGAAWFWYAGGPGRLAKEPLLYQDLLDQVRQGKLTENDREHIERDLHRTFPDNIRFKPNSPSHSPPQQNRPAAVGRANDKSLPSEPESPILSALRRVLQAFAVHNPTIGYCQSLNFIAGLLLLFLGEDEEKVFILLTIITSQHLPGTHGVSLEGANIDIAVLMSCIKDALPAVWAKLDDKSDSSQSPASSTADDGSGSGVSGIQALRLPTISLATTAWFMSLFVGTLPIESVLRVWDCLFLEGSRTLFRVALALFRALEPRILAVADPMEIFQIVQTVPRTMLDVNALLEACFRRRGGSSGLSQELVEKRREERRIAVRDGWVKVDKAAGMGGGERRWKRWKTNRGRG